MDSGAPKQVTVTCKKCKADKQVNIHWKDSTLFSTCKNCKAEYCYQFKDWQVVAVR
jgi:hypothetical protein